MERTVGAAARRDAMRPRGSRAWAVVLAAAAIAAGIGLGSPVLLRVAYVLLALLVGCPLYADLSLRCIAVRHRAGAARLIVGDRLLEVFHVRSRAPWPIMHLDVVAHQGVSGSRARWDVAIGPRGDEEWTSVQTAVARGRYAVGVAELAVT